MRKLIGLIVIVVAVGGRAGGAELPSWMSGTWRGTAGGVQMEEHWTTSEGGLMLGVHRDVRGGKASFEFLRVEAKGGGLAYIAQPGGNSPTAFDAVETSSRRIVFENRKHDFPQRIIYWLEDARLCARVEGTIGGEAASEQWCWDHVK